MRRSPILFIITCLRWQVVAIPLGLMAAAPATAQTPSDPVADAITYLIPEPLLFDLALSLGTPRGQAEVNAILRVPTGDEELIWIPEIEGTPLDPLAVEVELEFRGSVFNGLDLAG
jgi:hypothetical protein